jgi:hypothetical protein
LSEPAVFLAETIEAAAGNFKHKDQNSGGNVKTDRRAPRGREKLESAGLKFVADDRTTPEYLAKFVQSEIAKWAVPIKASGISVD